MTIVFALIRFAHLASSALLVGWFAFGLIVSRPAVKLGGGDSSSELAAFERRQLRLAKWTLVTIFVTGLLAFWLQITSVTSVALPQSLSPEIIAGVLVGTRYGIVWLIRMIVMLLMAVVLFRQRQLRSVYSRISVLILSVALVSALAFSGHAAAGEGIWLVVQLAADTLHLAAASVWLGGLPAFALFLATTVRIDRPWAWVAFKEATRRFSLLGLVAVTTLLLTGFLNAWTLVGAVPPLVGTTYGQLLIGKLMLLMPLIAVAAINRRALKPRILALRFGSAVDRFRQLLTQLKRNVLTEAVLGACILLIVGAMSVTPPARHIQPDWPFSFRWNWNALNGSAKIRAQFAQAKWFAGIGVAAIGYAVVSRRRRRRALAASLVSLAYGGWVAHSALSIDAYPTTYTRPSVPYNVISVANGLSLYQDACAVCHGVGGYGDGPAAKELKPRPADLTAKHSADHTAGDLFWWLTYGIKGGAMPGFAASLEEEERWDMINFLRALSAAERARQMSALVEPEPWLVAPDFSIAPRPKKANLSRTIAVVKS